MTVTGIWRQGNSRCQDEYCSCSTNAHITCLSCGAAKPVKVFQYHAEKFLEDMNSKVLVFRLKALGLIPDIVETNVLQSKSREVKQYIVKYRQSISFGSINFGSHFPVACEGEKRQDDLRNSHKSLFVVILNITLCSLDVNISIIHTTASDKGQERR